MELKNEDGTWKREGDWYEEGRRERESVKRLAWWVATVVIAIVIMFLLNL